MSFGQTVAQCAVHQIKKPLMQAPFCADSRGALQRTPADRSAMQRGSLASPFGRAVGGAGGGGVTDASAGTLANGSVTISW
jgi:hypothetical protein